MRNSVLRALFHGAKERKRAVGVRFLALLLSLALLAALLCGCDGQKAKDGASANSPAPESGKQASEDAAPVEEQAPKGGEQAPEGAAPIEGKIPEGGEQVLEGGTPVEGQTREGGEQAPEGGTSVEWSPEGGEFTGEQPPANDGLTITISGLSGQISDFSNIVKEVNEKVTAFDGTLTQISKKANSNVSTPFFIVSLLFFCALSAGLTSVIVIRSFNGKLKELEEQISEQRAAANQQTQDLQAAIYKAATQKDLVTLAQYITGTSHAQTAQKTQTAQTVQKARNVPATQSSPEKAYYEVFPPRSSAEVPTLAKSDTHQPIVGWVSSGILVLEPALDDRRKCSVDNLYSEQMTACFIVQPHDPVGSADFYAVDINKRAQASFVNGRYELSVQGQLTARI